MTTRTIPRTDDLHAALDRRLEPEIERIKEAIRAKLEAADDVGAARYEVETAIANARVEIDLDLYAEP